MLQPGERVIIGMISNEFDSRHSLRFGGEYPGESQSVCTFDPDTQEETIANAGTSEMPVYFVIETFMASDSIGAFELQWEIVEPVEGVCS